jgi:SAM-dependent methyltransferase
MTKETNYIEGTGMENDDVEPPYRLSGQYYDKRNSWKNYAREVESFCERAESILGRPLTSVLDLACGTGGHAVEFAQKGIGVTGVDLSEEMLAIAIEKARALGLDINFLQEDMAETLLESQFDAAAIFFGSFGYLLTDEQVLRLLNHLDAMIVHEGFVYIELWNTQGFRLEQTKGNYTYGSITRDGELTLIDLTTNNLPMETGIDRVSEEHFVIQGNEVVANFKELHEIRTYTIPQLASLVHQSPWKNLDTETRQVDGLLTHHLKAILTR